MKRILTAVAFIFLAGNLYAQLPDDPTTLTANATSSSVINLGWAQVNDSPGIDGYVIFAIETGGIFPAASLPGASELDLADGTAVARLAGEATTTFSGFTGLSAGTSYTFRIYTHENGDLSANFIEASDFTFSTAPGSHSATFTAIKNVGDGNRIDLTFAAASTITDAEGYVIYRKQGSAPVITGLNDGASAPATLDGGNTILVTTTNDTDLTFADDGLAGGQTFHYVLVPFNWNGVNAGTYNFRTGGAPTASATTDIVLSVAEIEGLPANIAPSPLGSGSSDQAILGFAITSDGATTFESINVQLTDDPGGKFSSATIYRSVNGSFEVSDTDIGMGFLQSDHISFSGINYPISAGTTNFFIVVDIATGVDASTPAIQPSLSETDLTFSTGSAAAFSFDGIDYTFVDATPPAIVTLNPADNATGVSVSLNQLVITFSEEVNNIGTGADNANRIRILTVPGGVEHEVIDPSAPGKVTIGGPGNTQATIALTVPLTAGDGFSVRIGSTVFEDNVGNDFAGTVAGNWNFTIESAPSITNFRNATNAGTTTSACANDVVTINGTGFGSALKPTITLNGVFVVDAADVLTFNNTQITFTLQPGAPNGTITVTNASNGLTSAPSGSSLTVLPAITTGLSVTFDPTSPAQGNDVDITVVGSEDNLTYELFLDTFDDDGTNSPNGTGSSLDTDTRADGSVILNAGVLGNIGTYYYFIEAERAECTTRLINDFSINIAPLTATASASSTTICNGESLTLQGAATGGTGFYSFQWLSGAVVVGTGPVLTVNPSTSRTYTLKVISNNAAEATDDIAITVNPVPTAQFLAGIKSKFADQDSVYRLSDSVNVAPPGGTMNMTGLGVSKHGDGKFYFDPKTVGPQNDLPVYLSYTFNNCTGRDTLLIDVNAANAITGLEDFYCENIPASDPLTHNPAYLAPYSYQYWDGIGYGTVSYTYTFKKLALYRCDVGDIDPDSPTNPLQPTGAPGTYILDPSLLAAGGYTYNCFYIIVVADTEVDQVNSSGVSVYNYTYEGWASYQYFELRALKQLPTIISIKEDQDICSDGTAIVLQTDIPSYTTLNYTEDSPTDNPISFDGGTGTYSFDPADISFGPSDDQPEVLTITYHYNDGDGVNPGCDNTVTRTFNVIPKIQAPVADDQTYCQRYEGRRVLNISSYRSDLLVRLKWYDGTSKAEVGDGETYDTNISTDAPTSKDYEVRQEYRGCLSQADGVNIIITPAPDPDITFPNQCEDREGIFNGPTENVTEWLWDFGDSTPTSTEQNPAHTYVTPGIYPLKLLLTSDINGQVCTTTVEQSITVGQNPKPTISYRLVCEGDFTELTGGSADIPVVTFAWDFKDGDVLARGGGSIDPIIHSGRTTGSYNKPLHQFQTPDTYRVLLTAYTNLGCYDTLSRKVTILDYLPAFNSDAPYVMANEEGGKGFWRVEDINDSSTWVYAVPAKSVISSATPSWVTGATGPYKPRDVSYVNSPCLNIRDIEKPVLSIDYFVNTPPNTDGAVLEYSLNDGDTWKSVGFPNEGSNWFNTTGFFLGNIGSSPVGWSGRTQTEFLSGKHALDNIEDFDDMAEREKVRFRIAFASDPATQDDGFAFYNFSITKRNRTLLVENFTNELDGDYVSNNNNYLAIPALETTKIQYHVSYPNDDSNSRVNATDPSARAAFYGVVLSDGIIPRGYIDGKSGGNFTNPLWGLQIRDERALIPSPFRIDIDASGKVDGQLHIATTVNVLENFAGRPILHVAIVEKDPDGTNENVLRKMLPNAAGTTMNRVYLAGQTEVYDHYFSTRKAEIDLSDLAVVVFIQDEVTKEVYQSEIHQSPAQPDIITGIEIPEFAEKIAVYPNPADKEFEIRLPDKTTDDIRIRMIDSYGHEIMVPGFTKGEQTKIVHTADFAGGLYIMQMESSKGMIRRKVMVLHE